MPFLVSVRVNGELETGPRAFIAHKVGLQSGVRMRHPVRVQYKRIDIINQLSKRTLNPLICLVFRIHISGVLMEVDGRCLCAKWITARN